MRRADAGGSVRDDAVSALRVEATTAKVGVAFAQAGVEAIFLKGVSTERWLYPEESRPASDVDVLVGPEQWRQAEATLVHLGLRRSQPPDVRDGLAHAVGFDGTAGVVDLHRRVVGMHRPDAEAWSNWWSRREPMLVAGETVWALDEPARCVVVAAHAAQHGSPADRPIDDLARALRTAPPEVWRAAADLAERLLGEGAMAAGLALSPDGRARAEELGLGSVVDAEASLRARGGRQHEAALAGVLGVTSRRQQARIGWRYLVPPSDDLAAWAPRLTRWPGGRIVARVARPIWAVGRALVALPRARRIARARRVGPGPDGPTAPA